VIRRAAGVAAAAATIALTLCGCGLLDGGRAPRPSPPSSTSTSASASALAIGRTRRTHELPTPAGPVDVAGGWRTPSGAVSAFATVYINWTAATVASRLRALAPRDGAPDGEPREYTVVTRERTSAARDDAYRGLVAEWHVSVATVTRRADGLWVVSGWQPES
jgi:hypothetical protein